MSEKELIELIKKCEKAFAGLKPYQALDLSRSAAWKIDKETVLQIAMHFIDGRKSMGDYSYFLEKNVLSRKEIYPDVITQEWLNFCADDFGLKKDMPLSVNDGKAVQVQMVNSFYLIMLNK